MVLIWNVYFIKDFPVTSFNQFWPRKFKSKSFNRGIAYVFNFTGTQSNKSLNGILKSSHLRSVFTKSTRYILRKVIYWHFFLASHILMMVGCWVTWTWSSSETRQSRRIADNHLQGRRKRGARGAKGAMIPRFCRNRKYNRSRKTLLPSFFPQIFGPSAVSDMYCLL